MSGNQHDEFGEAARRLREVMGELYPDPGEAQARLAEMEAREALGAFRMEPRDASAQADAITRNVFVIYGRDTRARGAVFDFIRALDLHPLEWEQLIAASGAARPYLGEALPSVMHQAQAVIVLLTPDDLVQPHSSSPHDRHDQGEISVQAAPEVLVMLGIALAAKPNRTIVLIAGRNRPVPGLHGVNYVHLDGSATCWHKIMRRLALAGCGVNDQHGIEAGLAASRSWARTTDHEEAEDDPRQVAKQPVNASDLDRLRPAFGTAVLAALDQAAAQSAPGAPMDTLTSLLTLTVGDATADWDRICLEFGELGLSAVGSYADPLPYAGDHWNGQPVTRTCATAVRAAVGLAQEFGLLPVTAGVLALCLAGEPTTAASRALGATSEPAHAVLLELIQETLVGGSWRDFRSVLRRCFDRASAAVPTPVSPAGPGALDDEDPDVRRFVVEMAYQYESLLGVLNQFLRADTAAESGRLLELHPELLSARVDGIIAKSLKEAAEAGDGAGAERLRERRSYLQRHRLTGSNLPDGGVTERSGISISALRTRLERYALSLDPSLVLDTVAVSDAADLLASVSDLLSDTEVITLVGYLHFLRWMADQDDWGELQLAIMFLAPLADQRPDLIPKPVRTLLARERKRKPAGDDGPSRAALRTALTTDPPATAAWAEHIWQLGLALRGMSERSGDAMAREALAVLRHAVAITQADDPSLSQRLSSFGSMLETRFLEVRDISVLDEAIEAQQPAMTGATLPDRAAFPFSLSRSLDSMYQQIGDEADLCEALDARW